MTDIIKEVEGIFLEMIQRTPLVFSFRFRPKGKVEFEPGQFMEVIFDAEDKDLRHFLSFSSSPSKDYIEFTKRVSESRFSQRLKRLKAGEEVLFKLPLGNCVFKEEYKQIGFIIGGIGITPVISMLEYIHEKGLRPEVFLIYSNRNKEEIAFREKLDTLRRDLPMDVIYLISSDEPQEQGIRKGFIDLDFLSQYKDRFNEGMNFVFGPPKMVEAITGLFEELDTDKNKIKTEKFLGY